MRSTAGRMPLFQQITEHQIILTVSYFIDEIHVKLKSNKLGESRTQCFGWKGTSMPETVDLFESLFFWKKVTVLM